LGFLRCRRELWRRWKAGQSLHEIGRTFGKEHSSIRCLVVRHGGIVPAVRRRSRRVLTAVEREDISRGLASGASLRKIAQLLDRAASTVSREVARHGGRPEYRANEADQRVWDSALRPKQCLLGIREQLREIVASKLLLDWSPEQISGWLTTEYPSDESMRVSHETIYRSLFIQARGVLKKELVASNSRPPGKKSPSPAPKNHRQGHDAENPQLEDARRVRLGGAIGTTLYFRVPFPEGNIFLRLGSAVAVCL